MEKLTVSKRRDMLSNTVDGRRGRNWVAHIVMEWLKEKNGEAFPSVKAHMPVAMGRSASANFEVEV